MGFIREFKDFAMRGNLVDMAVAVVIGAAFSKVITAFVDGIVMPVIGRVILNVDFSKYNIILQEEIREGNKIIQPLVQVGLGNFISVLLDFVLVAFFVFVLIKAINRLKKKEKEAPAEPNKQEALLTEIRDLLKEEKK